MSHDDFDDIGPSSDDLTTEDHRHFYSNGRLVLTMPGDASEAVMWRRLDAYMKQQGFYPNVWFISDHGNAHLMSKPKRVRKPSKRAQNKFEAALAAAEKKYGDGGNPYRFLSGGWREHWPESVKDKLRKLSRAK